MNEFRCDNIANETVLIKINTELITLNPSSYPSGTCRFMSFDDVMEEHNQNLRFKNKISFTKIQDISTQTNLLEKTVSSEELEKIKNVIIHDVMANMSSLCTTITGQITGVLSEKNNDIMNKMDVLVNTVNKLIDNVNAINNKLLGLIQDKKPLAVKDPGAKDLFTAKK